jgi:sugar phosphate isomerase/epimerase
MIVSVENMIARRRVGDRGAVDMLKAAGFTGIDYSLCSMKDWDEVVGAPDAMEYAEGLRAYAEERGMVFCQSHAPFTFKYGMEISESTRQYAMIVRSMEFAAHLGAPMIVIHCVRLPDELDNFAYNLEYYRSFLPYARRFGIRIAVENLQGRASSDDPPTLLSLGCAESFCEMQRQLDDPMVCGCLDLGHALITTGDPADFIRKSKGFVDYLHIHDNDGIWDLHQLPALGEPEDIAHRNFQMPWSRVIAALKDIGYSGPVNLELLRYMDNFRTQELPLGLELAAVTGRAIAEMLEG